MKGVRAVLVLALLQAQLPSLFAQEKVVASSLEKSSVPSEPASIPAEVSKAVESVQDKPVATEETDVKALPEEEPQAMAMSAGTGSGETAEGGSGSGSGAQLSAGGLLNFQTDLFTGRLGYSYPIAVAPARQGSEPKVALAYSSAGGNSWCGVGWGLDIGFIQRNGKKGVPVKWSGTSTLTEYDNDKGFVVSFGGVSSELVLVSGTEYRAKTESAFLKFELLGSGTYWKITDRSGNQFFFGESTASRMDNPKSGWATGTGTFRWALNRIQDVNGNTTSVEYVKDGNSLYLSKINYNGHTVGPLSETHHVEFVLEDRNDDTFDFRAGFKAAQNKRLKEILVKVDTTLVRKYALGYEYSPSTTRSRLLTVTPYGNDGTSSLPPTTFTYQDKPFEFENPVEWTGVTGQSSSDPFFGLRSYDGPKVWQDMLDIDGDGLPDRIARRASSPYDRFIVQFNNGSSLQSELPLQTLTSSQTTLDWRSVKGVNNSGAVVSDMKDINADGYPDHVYQENSSPYDRYYVQFGTGHQGTDAFDTTPITFTGVASEDSSNNWKALAYDHDGKASFFDFNGDGYPDRVMQKKASPYDRYKIQINNGTSFNASVDWLGLNGEDNGNAWTKVFASDADGNTQAGFFDLNGDGLPDRVARKKNSSYNQFAVQFNNGYGFETMEWWGPVQSNDTGPGWNSPIGNSTGVGDCTLSDFNGDGLVDRIIRKQSSPYNKFYVQFNTGAGFTSMQDWTNVQSEDSGSSWNAISYTMGGDKTVVDLMDMNGDGLVDRVYRKKNSPYDKFYVQLNKGPIPDLMKGVANGMGGSMEATYKPSTQYNNRDKTWTTDPWTEKAKGLLPFPVQTVYTVTVNDGMGHSGTTTYSYEGGMFDPVEKEFRGFYRASSTDPTGIVTKKYFHQSGGRDGSSIGEYNDSGSKAKKGIPFLTESYGSDGKLYSRTLNKVDEVVLDATTGRAFPFIKQTVTLSYDGSSSTGGNYRATAQKFEYDNTSLATIQKGNLTKTTNMGEVTAVNLSNGSFTDVTGDTVANRMEFATLSNAAITDKPSDVWIEDESGNVLRRTKFTYHGSTGRVTKEEVWRNTSSSYLTSLQFSYDAYGNIETKTEPNGVYTYLTYDSAYKTFPVTQQKGSFTSSTTYDARSGQILEATDIRNMKASSTYDVFYRLTETKIGTSAGATPSLWRTKTSYNIGGIVSSLSQNYIRQQVYDPNDTTNGQESYTYADGLGRTIQSRSEAETGQYRVSNVFFDNAGRQYYEALPVFSSGSAYTAASTGSLPGTLKEFDAINRPWRTTPPAGDTNSPTAPVVSQFSYGTDPWAVRTLDPLGKAHRATRDAYSRIRTLVEETSSGNYTTTYTYDLVGNLTQTQDHAANVTTMTYNSLGQKTGMTEPNMGTWSYTYDVAGRLIEQLDAKGNKVTFQFLDSIGRITSKEVFAPLGTTPVSTVSYEYDGNGGDTPYAVGPGQLYKVTDSSGWEKFSYDARGRVVKSSRYLNLTTTPYTVETNYDEADRPVEVTYPNGAATLEYTYDTGGNLIKVESTAGTGANEIFYQPQGFNALGQITGIDYGNGQSSTYEYYANSKRLKRLAVAPGANPAIQDLTYAYDEVSNVKSIFDSVTTGSGTQNVSNITYDDLHRLTSLTSMATGLKSYSYDAIGNITSQNESGTASSYTYGSSKPHAVTAAHGKTYAYDANGNMTTRDTQTLTYDPENRLVDVTDSYGSVLYAYAHDGSRLWKTGGSGNQIWIGSIYEIKGGKELCHVLAGNKRIATFEPSSGMARASELIPGLDSTGEFIVKNINWTLQEGRYPITLTLLGCLMLLGLMLASRDPLYQEIFAVKRRRKKPLEALYDWIKGIGYQGWMRSRRGVFLRSLLKSLAWRLVLFTGGRRYSRLRPSSPPSVILRTTSAVALCEGGSEAETSGQRVLHPPDLRPLTSVLSYTPTPWRTLYRQTVCFITFIAVFFCSTPVHASSPVYDPVFYYYHGDNLGSSNIITDRAGEVVQRYTYSAFGRETFQDNTSAFEISNRFTGQIFDDDTGLYYYNARYYDSELGRFISADTIVQDPQNPQTLNRYAYCGNNPLKYTDPSGHDFGITAFVVGVLIGAAVGAATAAATGGNILMGLLTGAISGAFAGVGAGLTTGLTANFVAGIITGAASGAVNSAITGGNIALGALSGAIGGAIGFGVGRLHSVDILGKALYNSVAGDLIGFATGALAGGLSGGIGAELAGGDFADGFKNGAIGGAIGYAIATDLPDSIGNHFYGTQRPHLIWGFLILVGGAILVGLGIHGMIKGTATTINFRTAVKERLSIDQQLQKLNEMGFNEQAEILRYQYQMNGMQDIVNMGTSMPLTSFQLNKPPVQQWSIFKDYTEQPAPAWPVKPIIDGNYYNSPPSIGRTSLDGYRVMDSKMEIVK